MDDEAMNETGDVVEYSAGDMDGQAPEDAAVAADEALLRELRERMRACLDFDGDARADAMDDLEFLVGKSQWDSRIQSAREFDGRPCMTVNKLPTFLHLVQNNLRQNVPSIHVAAVDDDADVETAEVMQGLVRHIEYDSNADIAYDTASTSAAQVGFGYFRLVTEYESPNSFDQCIRFKRVRNPLSVYFDPLSVEADGSDARYVIMTGKYARKAFLQEFPGAKCDYTGFDVGLGDGSDRAFWMTDEFVRVVEYYRIAEVPDLLIELSDGSKGYASDLESIGGQQVVRSRPTNRRVVEWYKATSLEVLERAEILCDWIPVVPVYGDEVDLGGRIVRSGLIRHAKDPARMYNYWLSSATEEVALRTKAPYIGAEGQFEGYEDDWGAANMQSPPYLEYKPVTLDGSLLPAPVRQPPVEIPVGYLQMLMIANDNIKATTGLFDSSLGAIGTATSGVQETAQQRQGDLANYHLADNLARAVRHAGRCLMSMIPRYYDATRMVRILGEDGKLSHVRINRPKTPDEMQKARQSEGNADGFDRAKTLHTVANDLTVGRYDLTVSTGPSYQTLRQEAARAQVDMAKSWPRMMEVAGDIVVGNMDWPGAEEISERIKRTIPQAVTGDEDDGASDVVQTPRGPVPRDQVGPMLDEMNGQMQAMAAELEKAKAGIARAEIDARSRVEVASINATSAADVAELNALVKLLIERMQPPPALAAEVAEDLTEEPGGESMEGPEDAD